MVSIIVSENIYGALFHIAHHLKLNNSIKAIKKTHRYKDTKCIVELNSQNWRIDNWPDNFLSCVLRI